MPVKKKKKRNFRSEYLRYHAKPAQRRRNDARKKTRRAMVKTGAVRKGDGRDIHHKDGNPKNLKRSNLAVTSKRKNRSFKRTRTARKK